MKATVDGKEVDIITADYGLMAIPVEKGKHVIEVKYRPTNFYLGFYITVIGICILIGYIVFLKARENNKKIEEQD